jgi:hypothetical protein
MSGTNHRAQNNQPGKRSFQRQEQKTGDKKKIDDGKFRLSARTKPAIGSNSTQLLAEENSLLGAASPRPDRTTKKVSAAAAEETVPDLAQTQGKINSTHKL